MTCGIKRKMLANAVYIAEDDLVPLELIDSLNVRKVVDDKATVTQYRSAGLRELLRYFIIYYSHSEGRAHIGCD